MGSSLTAASSRPAALLQILLRRLRLFQLVQALLAGVTDTGRADGQDARRTLFATAAAGSLVPFGSELFDVGLGNFEANLEPLLDQYRQAGIPVYIGTLVSNEKGLPPFEGGPGPHVDLQQWREIRERALTHLESGNVAAARIEADQLLSLDDNAAEAWWELAQVRHQAGQLREAREAYRHAKDLDALRFRAPEALNRRIREMGRRTGATTMLDTSTARPEPTLEPLRPDGVE